MDRKLDNRFHVTAICCSIIITVKFAEKNLFPVYIVCIGLFIYFRTKYLNIIRSDNAVSSGLTPRLSWCPYIPDAEEPHENVYMIAVYFVSFFCTYQICMI